MAPGTGIKGILTLLRFWVGRHQSLRTKFRFVRGPIVRLQQVVVSSGEIPLNVVDIDGGGIDALVRDLAHLDWATGEQSATVAAATPLVVARDQRSHGPTSRCRPSRRCARPWRRARSGGNASSQSSMPRYTSK
jgi:hypothetical protein